ncbi:hypothetical protein B0H11DRAFT_1997360 [Mycena galericulata]|nr:hypothetical protein B0H11DRAFT_1997360 [Mycena galericulata]
MPTFYGCFPFLSRSKAPPRDTRGEKDTISPTETTSSSEIAKKMGGVQRRPLSPRTESPRTSNRQTSSTSAPQDSAPTPRTTPRAPVPDAQPRPSPNPNPSAPALTAKAKASSKLPPRAVPAPPSWPPPAAFAPPLSHCFADSSSSGLTELLVAESLVAVSDPCALPAVWAAEAAMSVNSGMAMVELVVAETLLVESIVDSGWGGGGWDSGGGGFDSGSGGGW